MLVAYTDGITEARNDADDEFGDDRLAALLDGCRSQDAATICAAILNAVRDHRGTRQDQDDVTVMVVISDPGK
jgi:sigma-B regulation protein RsbU (phosphoserine phosphatase)